MLELALHYPSPAPVSLKAIYEAHGISQRFLVQIFLQLRAAGLVTSTRGAAGGYHLTRPPEEITLADIVKSIEDPETVNDQNNKLGKPLSPLRSALYSTWNNFLIAQQKVLESTTLADLVIRSQQQFDISYQI
jgi:Rrf2 family protein